MMIILYVASDLQSDEVCDGTIKLSIVLSNYPVVLPLMKIR